MEALVARLLDLVPAGHEVAERDRGVELAVYVDAAELSRLRSTLPDLTATPVDPGWRDAWRGFHRPVIAGPLWVGPPWERPAADRPAVVIDPGQAFGTGAHPTTRLCIELLADLARGSVLDAGCGSGVIAIAALRLGFAPVIAVDADPAAVHATRANAAANGVAIDAYLLDIREGSLPDVDVAVANIERTTVEAFAGRVEANVLVASGYLQSEQPRLSGWQHRRRCTEAGWAADWYVRSSIARP